MGVVVSDEVLVVGRGAIGSLCAARLARAGARVCLQSRGLVEVGPRRISVREAQGESWTATISAGPVNAAARAPLVAIIALKTTQLDAYRPDLEAIAARGTVLIGAFNGLVDCGSTLPVWTPAVVRGTADIEGHRLRCHAFDAVLLPEVVGERCPPRLADRFESAGFRFVPADRFEIERHLKLSMVTTGARMALADASIGKALRDPRLRDDCAAVVAESLRILATRLPARLREPFLTRGRAMVTRIAEGYLLDPETADMSEARPSLAVDLEDGRPTEVEHLNGAVLELARRGAGEAPLNRCLVVEIRRAAESGMTPAAAAASEAVQERLRLAFAGVAA